MNEKNFCLVAFDSAQDDNTGIMNEGTWGLGERETGGFDVGLWY
jgi:hypothetical protein